MSKNEWQEYRVFERNSGDFVGATKAKSAAHAINNVRFRKYGSKAYNCGFFAIQSEKREPQLNEYEKFLMMN